MASAIGSQNENIFNPKLLYEYSIEVITKIHENVKWEFYVLPPRIHFDIVYGLYERKFYKELTKELSNFENICKFLKVPPKRLYLHRCFQTVMDFCYSTTAGADKPSFILAHEYMKKAFEDLLKDEDDFLAFNKVSDKLISQGLAVASFLSEGGWLMEAELILMQCKSLLHSSNNSDGKVYRIECFQRLLHVQNGFCEFKNAHNTYKEAYELVLKYQSSGFCPNVALLYSEFSTLFVLQSDYEKAYEWSIKALMELVPGLSPITIIDVYRQTAKSCVLKREFKKAGLLIREACKISRMMMEDQTLKYADTLIDFGFYLLNVDEIHHGIEVYEAALHARQSVFGIGSRNLHVATAHEDLAYASYVYNYSNGMFQDARNQAEKAISLLLCLLPSNHLLLSSCKRVKALILEEMALENTDKDIEAKYLEEAHGLHIEALNLALEAFGEKNVQTAKHYGNLGRLYQSMKKYNEAEKMHLKAISIKESLLGSNDYEVALSVGHLASLYNYDMGYFNKAETLYLRSIEIGKKLFGEAYSGLEYDYRGLLRVYANQFDVDKRLQYMTILSSWKVMREQLRNNNDSPFSEEDEELISLDLLVRQFQEL